MISIALRNLLSEKTRLLIAVGGVAFSVMLILIILSLYQGWKVKSTEYIRSIDTDLWVSQNGSADITTSASLIPDSTMDQIKQIDGVAEVDKFIGKPATFQINNQDTNAYIIGVSGQQREKTGPKRIVAGRGEIEKGEIVVDEVMANSKKLELGEKVEIFGKSFKIVGISAGSNMFLFQFIFMDQEEAVNILKLDNFSNFLLVKTTGSLGAVKSEINKIGSLEALEKDEFVTKNRRQIDEVFLPIITVLVAISVLVGTAVIGLTIYTATIEKAREFGVLKALGASNWQIYRVIFEQALASGVIGYFVGLALSRFLQILIPHFVAVFVTYSRLSDIVVVFGMAIGMSVLASYIPVRRILSIDPAEVFRS